MGLDINSIYFLAGAHRSGVKFGDVLMIGRQDLNIYPAKLRKLFKSLNIPAEPFDAKVTDTGFAEPVFKSLGALSVSSLDASAFEKAEIVHDLNQPVSAGMKQKFDLVYDGGTLEHVFNFPVALQNCMEMLREGGHFITHTCANNWCGHGFYQFSPELFYSVLNADNGFKVERMILHVVGPYNQWYEVASPQELCSRVELFNAFPLQLLVLARRVKVVPLFAKTPQQSDYTPRWLVGENRLAPPASSSRPRLARRLPGLARLQNVFKVGWGLWRYNTLRNRHKFRPVAKF